MNGREALAVLVATPLIAGGIAAGAEVHAGNEANDQATAAQACLDAYGLNNEDGGIDKATLDCFQNPWVLPGVTVPITGFYASSPSELIQGYVDREKGMAKNFDWAPAAIFGSLGLLGAGVTVWFKGGIATARRRETVIIERAQPAKSNVTELKPRPTFPAA